ncbi:MAG: T9SS type A sorting domain-containing protein, partial [Bacteroidales bacterium]|nr:T9SS type A sorting domain-containing protein [Bacteroidales bacterium]
YIDDITLGAEHEAGEWADVATNVTETSYTLTGLTAGTKYDVRVKGNCDPEGEYSNIISFTTLSETIITDPEEMTNIAATECVIVKDGGVLTLTGTNSGNANNLIIEEGGQVIHNSAVQATLKKDITASPSWGSKDAVSGWYLIASPVADLPVGCATTGDYDFYKYDEEHTQWLNQKVGANNITNFEQGIGYLYANKETTTIDYLGSLVGTNTTVTKALSYANTNDDQKGFNLMGNPFSCNITGNVTIGVAALTTYYSVEGGNELTAKTLDAEHPIKPGQGFMVQATAENQDLVFNPTAKSRNENTGYISIKAGNKEFTDNAFIQIANGNTLRKMTLSDNSSIVYVMNGGKDYAAARIDALEGSMPVCFKANKLGSYTITIEAKDIKTDYLHLIDNFSHEDIDLLLEPSYTFIASDGDNASRFTLVFRAEGSTVTSADIFAYQNGSDIVVNGNGELQVFDVMGRLIATQHINGVETVNVNANGVYIFKLNEKTQKIVVR